jgi:ankyrin repeat protein
VSETLFQAVKAGNVDAVRALVERDPAGASARDVNGTSAVLTALYYGHGAVAEALVEAGAELDIFEAAATGRTAVLERLLTEDPARLDAYSGDGFTSLMLAAFMGRQEAMDFLLRRGANPRLASRGGLKTSPLLAALAGPRPDLALPLIAAGADVHAQGDSGFTPLHSAAHHERPDIVRALLAAGADPRAKTADGKTPADLARTKGNAQVAAVLEEAVGG